MIRHSNQPDVSIILTSWNVRELLRESINSIYEMTRDVEYEIIVVDDASADGTAAVVRKEFPNAKLLVNEKNLGYAKSNNLGAEISNGRYVLLLNSDTLLINNAIKILIDFLDKHSDVGVCGGWLRNKDMTSQVSYGDFPSFYQAIFDALFLNDLFPGANFPNRGRYPNNKVSEPMEVDYITGADILIRKELIDRLGLFDERFHIYCEETDFCYRVKYIANMKVYFVPEAQIIHLGGMSYKTLRKYQIQLQYSSYNKFLTKHYGPIYSFCTRVLYAWQHFVFMVVRYLKYLLASSDKKAEKKNYWLNSWYVVRYSLAPNEQLTG
ncbi:MAG TPA: glycosyltransferase family 2 protein [Bacteroidota bacterium]|nr:glycosyltransferase family 2 protein [Bacteroidota bacterium]